MTLPIPNGWSVYIYIYHVARWGHACMYLPVNNNN